MNDQWMILLKRMYSSRCPFSCSSPKRAGPGHIVVETFLFPHQDGSAFLPLNGTLLQLVLLPPFRTSARPPSSCPSVRTLPHSSPVTPPTGLVSPTTSYVSPSAHDSRFDLLCMLRGWGLKSLTVSPPSGLVPASNEESENRKPDREWTVTRDDDKSSGRVRETRYKEKWSFRGVS